MSEEPIKIELKNREEFKDSIDFKKYQSAVYNNLKLVMEYTTGLLKLESPRGETGIFKAGWTPVVKRQSTNVVGRVVNATAYGHYVIYPTNPARFNPWRHIIGWVEKRIGLVGPDAARMAYFIGLKRMKFGSPGIPGFFDKVTPDVMRAVRYYFKRGI